MSAPAHRLRELIRSSGPIPFAVFMEEALYGEDGYYRKTELPIGEAGDYVTGSSFSPLFGRATARLVRRLDAAVPGGGPAAFFEAGFGMGTHLATVGATLLAGDDGDDDERRLLAWDRVERPVPPGVQRIGDLTEIPEGSIDGLIFSYELFDALPVHRLFGRKAGTVGEVWVDLDANGDFAWREGGLSDPALEELLGESRLAPKQIADLSPGWAPLYGELARRLGRGLLVTCDYGYPRQRLLDPQARSHGTLACYSRQRVHRNPFAQVGEQDLTAHVDFTALIAAGEAAGLSTVALTRQGFWLTSCGVFKDLVDAGPETRQEAIGLLGEGMGEEIRVLVQARGVEAYRLFEVPLLGRS
jgi:SAM-dependent MidA family methyltransferase